MFDFISIQFYTPLFYYIMGLVVLFTVIHTMALEMDDPKNLSYTKITGWIILFFIIFYMGYRPINRVFVDMLSYAFTFNAFQDGLPPLQDRDYLFTLYTILCSKIMSANTYFFLCSVIYVLPLFIVSKKWFGKYWFYAFIFFVVSFSFWAYGTNTIRNGMASSLFLFAISRDRRIFQFVWLLIAINIHKTLLLPSIAFAVTIFFHNPKYILSIWALSIPLSIIGGGFWEGLFSTLNLDEDRMHYLTEDIVDKTVFSRTGFRWDFLLYSSTAIFAGWFYIYKLKYQDKTYNQLYCIYIICNAIWILIIRANYSDRFAYLSWFMMPLIIIYPLIKEENIVTNQHAKIGTILLVYFGFTFFMNIVIR